MKAVIFYEHGGRDKLLYEERPQPEIQDSEVLVRVKACALNHLDLWARQGLPNVKIPLPHISGCDISGEVADEGNPSQTEVGKKVIVAPGIGCGHCNFCLSGRDNYCRLYQVVGYNTDGGYAEYVKVPESNLLPTPDALSFEEAASVPLVFMTAWHMLVGRAQIGMSEDVLILAAGSGVGIASLQVAKLFNARVIATAGSEEKLKLAERLGADFLINHRTQDIVEEVKRITGKRGVDIVVEHVGEATWDKSVRALTQGGRMVTCGATTGREGKTDIRYVFNKQLSILGSYMGSKAELMEVLRFFEEGRLKPVVYRILPLKEAAEAQRIMEESEHFGKIILKP